MTKYHVNPATGRTGICRAVQKCRFGDMPHFDDQQEARNFYENEQKRFNEFVSRSIIKQGKKAYTIEIFEKDENSRSFNEMSTFDPELGNFQEKFRKIMETAPDKARVVIENGNVWEKNKLYGDDSWKFKEGDFDLKYRLEPKKTYSGSYVRRLLFDYGGRIEAGE